MDTSLESKLRRIADGKGRPLSIAESISMLDPFEQTKLLREIAPTPKDMEQLKYNWEFWARPNQKEPLGRWSTWAIFSGRGFGKTRCGAEAVIKRARNGPYFPIALIGQTKADVRDTMVEIFESSIMKISPPYFMPKLETTKRRVTWPNGMAAIMYSGDEPDQLRGPQHGFGWLDELAKFKYPVETWNNFSLGLRMGDNPQAIITTTPRPIPIIKQLVEDPMTVVTTGSTYENIGNLPLGFIRTIFGRYENTRLGAQEIYGKILSDIEGALWTRKMLEDCRVTKVPEIYRIIVAVDPNTRGLGGGTNQVGIVICGLGTDNHGYVLEDATVSTNMPDRWASQVVAAYNRYGADRVIAESNQGGEMVRSTLRTIDNSLPVTLVHASRSKFTRAEPISNLYSSKRVHHLGMFPDLEDEMTSWVPGEDSPDRLDALVWGMTELMINGRNSMDINEIAAYFDYLA